MIIVNLGGKNKPHTQGKTTRRQHRDALTFSFGADTALPKKIQAGRTGEKCRNKHTRGHGGEEAGGDWRVDLQPVGSVWLPVLRRQGCHLLPWAGRRWAWKTDVHRCSGCPGWISCLGSWRCHWHFLPHWLCCYHSYHLLVPTTWDFHCPLSNLIPGNALCPKGLVTCLLRNKWTESRTEFLVSL